MQRGIRIQTGPLLVLGFAVAVAGGLMGALSMCLTFGGDVALPVGACTAVLSVLLVLPAATYTKSRAGAAVACLLGGIAAGIVNSPVSYVVAELLRGGSSGRPPHLFSDAMAALVFGAVIAAPLGLLFGLVYLLPVLAAHRLTRDESHEATDRMARTGGFWLLTVSALTVLMGRGAEAPFSLGVGLALCMISVALASVGVAVGWLRLWLRRRWLRAVSQGRRPGWTITAREALLPWDKVVRPLLAGSGSLDAMVSRVVPHRSAGAYRTGVRLEPWALVRSDQISSLG